MKSLKRMSERQFNAAADSLRIREESLQIAHQVLVLGKSQANVATEYQVSKSAVCQLVSRVWKAALPDGFVTVTVSVPTTLGNVLERFSAIAVKEAASQELTEEYVNSLLVALVQESADTETEPSSPVV
ncbi:TrfB transcriptional repressor protein [compost metagenome]